MTNQITIIGRTDPSVPFHVYMLTFDVDGFDNFKSICGASTADPRIIPDIDEAATPTCYGCKRILAEKSGDTQVKTTGTPGSPVDMLTTKLQFIMNEALKEYFVSEMNADQKAQHIANLEIALAELKAKLQGWKVGHQTYLDTLTEEQRRDRMKLDQSYRVTIPKPKSRIEKKAEEKGINLEKFAKSLGEDLSDLFD